MRRPYGFEMSEDCGSCKLKKKDFFCQLSGTALREFDKIKSLSVYPSRALLFIEKERARGIFVLCEGQVKLSMGSKEGKTLILQIAYPGEVLGLMAAVADTLYETTAETLRASQVAFVPRDEFLKFINRHPQAYRSVVRDVISKYGAACDQLRTVGLSSTPRRLARLLLEWFDRSAEREQGWGLIELPLTHEEIGGLIGSSRETVTRTLSDFKDRHLITTNGGLVKINDRKALEAMAA